MLKTKLYKPTKCGSLLTINTCSPYTCVTVISLFTFWPLPIKLSLYQYTFNLCSGTLSIPSYGSLPEYWHVKNLLCAHTPPYTLYLMLY